ncbi:MAG: acyltransferase [Lachnospiraceae bacterium]|nr:acyltransferase [Lachnospiraceae bacterium]
MSQNMMSKSGREYTVELWRFFFCMAVLGLHFFIKTEYSFFRAGYLGVEFFFLLSGYGIYSYYMKCMNGKNMGERWYQFGRYIGARIIRLYPLYFLSLLCMLVFRIVAEKWSLVRIVNYMKAGWAEFLLLQCGPLGDAVLISPHWYVAAFFWGSVILLLLLLYTGKVGGYLLCPVISVAIYRYYIGLIGKIDIIYSYHAVLRALAGLSLGVFIGFAVSFVHAKKTEIPSWIRMSGYVIGNLILLGVFIYTNFGHRSLIDFVVIGLYAVALFLLFAVQIPVGQKKKAIFQRLSSWTYPIYLFQMPVIECLFFLMK